jgi:hypothetical protein
MTANDQAGRRGVFPAYVLLFATLYAGFGVMSPFLPALLQARGLRPVQDMEAGLFPDVARTRSSDNVTDTCSHYQRPRAY